MSIEELKPCPFCGGKAKLYGNTRLVGTKFKNYQVATCLNDDCSCRTGFCETVAEAIERWNTRKPIEKVVEQLEKEKEIHTEHYNNSLYKNYPDVKRRYEQTCFVIDKAIDIVKVSEKNDRTECSEYVIDNYHAEQNRKKLRIVRSK